MGNEKITVGNELARHGLVRRGGYTPRMYHCTERGGGKRGRETRRGRMVREGAAEGGDKDNQRGETGYTAG